MATNYQFSIAVHIMVALAYRGDVETTSAQLARSVNASPSFIRRTLAKLAKAGLVTTERGAGGHCRLGKRAERITLLDIYRAVDAPLAFAIHQYGVEKSCPVSCQIKSALETALQSTQSAMERGLERTKLADLLAEIETQPTVKSFAI